jgi:hypothetical protein
MPLLLCVIDASIILTILTAKPSLRFRPKDFLQDKYLTHHSQCTGILTARYYKPYINFSKYTFIKYNYLILNRTCGDNPDNAAISLNFYIKNISIIAAS